MQIGFLVLIMFWVVDAQAGHSGQANGGPAIPSVSVDLAQLSTGSNNDDQVGIRSPILRPAEHLLPACFLSPPLASKFMCLLGTDLQTVCSCRSCLTVRI